MLTGLRYSAEHSQFPPDAVLRAYSELIAGILDISVASAADITDPELTRLRLASNALARTKDQMSVKRAILADALAQGKLTNERTRALLGAQAEIDSAQRDFRTFANPEQQRMYNDTVIGLVVDLGNNLAQSALTRAEGDGNGDLSGLDPNVWDTSSTYTINLVHQVQQALLVQMKDSTDSLAAGARTSAITDSGIVLAVLLVAGVLSVIIARSLLRPLRVLRRSALEVAEHRLPAVVEGILNAQEPQQENVLRRLEVAPVPVFSREELGQVARALDAVHGEAVRLAGEQALLRENVNSMFVNLSRRSQDLVERQLSVLDRMEADEQEPDTLGGLFELDHLATRMRRNSENLLVLSGTDLGRTASGAVVADEIIGAALSEVEHYQRIELNPAPEIAVRGEDVNDLVHVISELLENATRYSPEQTIVTVASSLTPAGAWRIEIADRGAGMPQAEIDRANKRLESPPDVDVEVSAPDGPVRRRDAREAAQHRRAARRCRRRRPDRHGARTGRAGHGTAAIGTPAALRAAGRRRRGAARVHAAGAVAQLAGAAGAADSRRNTAQRAGRQGVHAVMAGRGGAGGTPPGRGRADRADARLSGRAVALVPGRTTVATGTGPGGAPGCRAGSPVAVGRSVADEVRRGLRGRQRGDLTDAADRADFR